MDPAAYGQCFCLCVATHCGVSFIARGNVGWSSWLRRLRTEEELLSATPQLPLPASTPQALSVSELLSEQFLILTNGHSLAIVSGVPQFRNNALQILAASKLNQSRCKQVTSAWVLKLKQFATGFCTVTVENTSSKPRPPKLLDFLRRTVRCRTVIKCFPPSKPC